MYKIKFKYYFMMVNYVKSIKKINKLSDFSYTIISFKVGTSCILIIIFFRLNYKMIIYLI